VDVVYITVDNLILDEYDFVKLMVIGTGYDKKL
jgi:hypothetical protein